MVKVRLELGFITSQAAPAVLQGWLMSPNLGWTRAVSENVTALEIGSYSLLQIRKPPQGNMITPTVPQNM